MLTYTFLLMQIVSTYILAWLKLAFVDMFALLIAEETGKFIRGEVVAIVGSNGDNSASVLIYLHVHQKLLSILCLQRGFAEVKWNESQSTSVHRVGSEGKVYSFIH